jgi:acyl carrier protein
MNSVDHQLAAVMREFFAVDPVEFSPAASLSELPGWDSIAHVKLLRTLESEFNVRFTVRDMVKMTTIDDIKRVIESKSSNARR